MDLVNSIAQMSMSMSAANFQRDLQTTMLKKAIEVNTDIASDLFRMIDSVPVFAGENGSILNVRA